MNPRAKQILKYVVEEYVESVEPVGSELIWEKYNFPFSPSTIRNEMLKLDQQGYLSQPHHSAGRVPTDKGYKFFVDQVMEFDHLSQRSKKIFEDLLKKAFGFQTKPSSASFGIKRLLEVISSEVHNLVFFTNKADDFFLTGLKELFDQPEFEEKKTFLEMIATIENLKEKINTHIAQFLFSQDIKVFIGHDIQKILSTDRCSIISASLGNGIIGILGPKRMRYWLNSALLNELRNFVYDKTKKIPTRYQSH